MPWSGDISLMGKLAERIEDLADIPSRASKSASSKIQALLEGQFTEGKDPYNVPWEPLAESTVDRGRVPPPLTDTHELRESVEVRPMSGAGVAISIGAPYAAPHQTGWDGPQGSGPARRILPDEQMPWDWANAIEDAVEDEVKKARR